MEDWQEWQLRADQIAADLNKEVDTLESTFVPGDGGEMNFRAFWPRHRDLKERVRTAPAIRLEAKLDLERRLRTIGSKAYKEQEAAFGRSSGRKAEILTSIAELRARAEAEAEPRALRNLRRDFDRLREEFDAGTSLAPADRQAVWDAWREANQFSWQRLTDLWSANEQALREILAEARQQAQRGNVGATRQVIGRFFEALRSREAKQDTIVAMKAEADAIRREAEEAEERTASQKIANQPAGPTIPALDTWRSELARSQEQLPRLREEVAELERQVEQSDSILAQAMIRGNLVDKKRKLGELERTIRTLEQRIAQTEESPLIFTA